jgi:LuxR family transcriptional regulator/LuxR family quorum-sensing system transcriptional regulator CciR
VWLARGKSKSVTADILEISPHTVDTTVRRIFRKLGVSDRTSAVMKAVNSGVIPAMSADVA